jgi:TolA-binding protein
MRPVITRLCAGLFRLLFFAVLAAASARPAWATDYSFTTKADMDTLSLGFAPQTAPPTVTRTGLKEISLFFAPGTEGLSAPPATLDFKQSRFIEAVRPIPGGLAVQLRADAVGFVAWPAGEGGVKLQIYRDPQGAAWTPPGKAPSPAAQAAAGPPPGAGEPPPGTPGQGAPTPGVKSAAAKPPPPGEKKPVDLPPLSQPTPPPLEAAAAPQVRRELPPLPQVLDGKGPAEGQAPTQPAAPGPGADPSHAVRAGIQRSGPDAARVLRPTGAPTPATPATPAPKTAVAPPPAKPQTAPAAPPPAKPQKAPATPPPLAAAPSLPGDPQAVSPMGLPPLPQGLESREGEIKAQVTPPAPPIGSPPVSPVFSGPQAVRAAISRDAPPAAVQGAASPPAAAPSGAIQAATPASPPAPPSGPPAGPDAAQAVPAAPEGETAASPEAPEGHELTQVENENDGMFMAAQAKRLLGDNAEALAMLQALKSRNTLTPEMREEVLYTLAETIYDINKADPLAHFDTIQAAFQEALNFNAKSSHIPGALLVLGMLNLKAGNIPEATAYFNILRKRYPNDENIPLIHFYWGEHYFEKGDYQKAAKEYQELIQRFPESRFVREASMGMAKSLVRLGQYKEAWQIADYIEKRWPRYYTEYPPLLRINGEIAYRLGEFAKSKDYYLTSYNIDPHAEGSDLVLARLGDVASRLGRERESTEFYELAVTRFPDAEGGLISKMRLAERGVYDDPSISDMFSAFDKPLQGGPEAIYAQIVRDHPKSPLAPLAQLKLAMWQLFKDRYLQALESATTFDKKFPDNPLGPRAGEVAAAAFDSMVEPMLRNQQYAQIAELWREHPLLAKNRSIISDKGQLAAALSFLRTGNPQESLRLALPYVTPTQTEPGMNALMLALHIYQEGDAWREILSLIDKVHGWKFTMDQRQRLEYAAAQALEHLGDTARSRPLWARLAADFSLDAPRRAIAMYYQAKEAKAKNDAEKTLVFAQEAVDLLTENKLDPDKIADCLNMLVDAARSLGQYPTALDYAERYGRTLPENGPDYAANRLRMAAVYREMGETDKWRTTLEQMRDAMPNTVYGRMAASELSARALEDRASALTRTN